LQLLYAISNFQKHPDQLPVSPKIMRIDKIGYIRYVHIGEGRYKETEAAIRVLLAEAYE